MTGERRSLPAWPFTALFVGYPVWWLLGVVDVVWIAAAMVMGWLLLRRGGTRLPLGTGVWLLFLLWALCSVIELPSATSAVAFAYRYAIYLSCTVLLVYVYNAREMLRERFVAGVMTAFWAITVAGGYLGVAFPATTFRTALGHLLQGPLSGVVPAVIARNYLVQQMVVRPLAQYNPDAYHVVPPRPSAPFLFTNNWGSAYSMLVPFVLVYLVHVRREPRRFWPVVVLLVASVVPAFLTLNRGMFLGLAVAAVYVAVRSALLGDARGLALVAGLGVVGVVAFSVLPVQARLDERLSENSSTVTRAALYHEVISATATSPVFGYGGPRPSANPLAPPVGTQGQFWLVLFSHGIGGAVLFVGWFLLTVALSLRRRDLAGIGWSTVVLVATVELVYYGLLPSGLPVVMVAAALALRGADPPALPEEPVMHGRSGGARRPDRGRAGQRHPAGRHV